MEALIASGLPWHFVIVLLGGLFPTCLRQAGWNDDEAIDADRQPYSLNAYRPVIPAQAGIQWFIQHIPA